jgi:hypothetical protein
MDIVVNTNIYGEAILRLNLQPADVSGVAHEVGTLRKPVRKPGGTSEERCSGTTPQP